MEACFKGSDTDKRWAHLPALISEAMEEIYRDCGWKPYDLADGTKPFPTMQMLYDKISEIFKTKGYSVDVKADLQTAIEVRIGTLLRRSIGRILNTNTSSPDTKTLMTKPVILELASLNEEEANLMTMFILSRIGEYVKSTRPSGSPLSHVNVLEEAHNIIGKVENSGGEDTANPKVEATKYVLRFLAEMRALGEALIIVDQNPSGVAPEVIKNTNVKLVHRIVSADDREDIGMTMLMDGYQMEDLARLSRGQSYLYQEGMAKPVRINDNFIPKMFPVLYKSPPDNKKLISMLHADTWWIEGLSVEIIQIIKDLEKLSSDIDTSVDYMNGKRIRLEREGENKKEIENLWRLFLEKEKKFNVQYESLDENATIFFKLMEQRSPECKEYAAKTFHPLLTKAYKMVNRSFGQFGALGRRMRESYTTVKC